MATVPRCRITLLGLGILTLLWTSPLSAQEQGTGTVTVDGETQSFTVESCDPHRIDHRGKQVWEEGRRGTVTVRGDVVEIAARQEIHFRPSGHVFEARRRQAADGTWHVDPQGDPAPGRLYQIDGSTVTAGGTFQSLTTSDNLVVEFRVEGATCLLQEPCVYPRCP